MVALHDGLDPLMAALKPGEVSHAKGEGQTMLPYLHLEDAVGRWKGIWKEGNWEGDAEDAAVTEYLKDAVELNQTEGTFLLSCGILYLDPSWLNKPLRAILDHRLADQEQKAYWIAQLKEYNCRPGVNFGHLKVFHDKFCITGRLTVGYLRFLWRDLDVDKDEVVFKRLLRTMSEFGAIFESTSASAPLTQYGDTSVLDNNLNLMVMVRLPISIETESLKKFGLPNNCWRLESVYLLEQSYIPAGLLGLLMARCIQHDLQLHVCWRYGASFRMGGPEVLLYLHPQAVLDRPSFIEFHVMGVPLSREVTDCESELSKIIKQLFKDQFPGLLLWRRSGDPRAVEGENAVMERIELLQQHADKRHDAILLKLEVVGEKVENLAMNILGMMIKLNAVLDKDYPFPSLISIRDERESAVTGNSVKNRAQRVWNGFKGVFRTKKRLHFLCPYDGKVIPCGLDGDGYPFHGTREWVKKL
ncbi:unnamed protein product, partial [Choristocarpus tenellus]